MASLGRRDKTEIKIGCDHTHTILLWGLGLVGVSNLCQRMAMNVAQHKIVNLLKTLFLLISFH